VVSRSFGTFGSLESARIIPRRKNKGNGRPRPLVRSVMTLLLAVTLISFMPQPDAAELDGRVYAFPE
jgi:hypothetical protein